LALIVRKAELKDSSAVDALLSEWFDWKPKSGRIKSVRRAIRRGEVMVALSESHVIGFIHYVTHEDIIDGGPNALLSAFYVTPTHRNKGTGSLLLEEAISDSLSQHAVGIETSTTHLEAKRLYERHHFRQTVGDIGEVFLELDFKEYLKNRPGSHQNLLQP